MLVTFIHIVQSDLIRSKTMKWAEHLTRAEENKIHTGILLRNLQEGDILKELGVDGRKY